MLSIEWLMTCFFSMQTRGHNSNSYCLHIHLTTTLFRSLSVTESIICCLYCFRVPLSVPVLVSVHWQRVAKVWIQTLFVCLLYGTARRELFIVTLFSFVFSFFFYTYSILGGTPACQHLLGLLSRNSLITLRYVIAPSPHHPYAFNDLYCLLLTRW